MLNITSSSITGEFIIVSNICFYIYQEFVKCLETYLFTNIQQNKYKTVIKGHKNLNNKWKTNRVIKNHINMFFYLFAHL